MLTRLREENVAASKLNGFALLLRVLLAVRIAGRYSTEVEPECYLLGRSIPEGGGGGVGRAANRCRHNCNVGRGAADRARGEKAQD